MRQSEIQALARARDLTKSAPVRRVLDAMVAPSETAFTPAGGAMAALIAKLQREGGR